MLYLDLKLFYILFIQINNIYSWVQGIICFKLGGFFRIQRCCQNIYNEIENYELTENV